MRDIQMMTRPQTAPPLRLAAAMLIIALLAGCMPDLKSDLPPDRIYWLEVPGLAEPPPVNLEVEVVPGLDSDRIWLLQRDQRLNYYAGAYWPDNLRPLLESLLVRSFGAGPAGPDARVLVERFFALEAGSGPPSVVVRALLEADGERCRFEHREAVREDRLQDIVAGHQLGLDALADALAEFLRSGSCA